jgi:GntR family transcriptional regulator, negative regulator for fad regulon and positive regulator of fabA
MDSVQFQSWEPLLKPAEAAESRLIEAILAGRFPIHSSLPGERDLASLLGVTRPTLREALQRLARDGWIEIQHGKATRVRDYWQEGNLAVLAAIAQYPEQLPGDFVPNLLQIRALMAPTYSSHAVARQGAVVAGFLSSAANLPDTPESFSDFDWQMHRLLTRCSGNPVFTLILNGFATLYPLMGRKYFAPPRARQVSRAYYTDLEVAARFGDARLAETLTRQVMDLSIQLWVETTAGSPPAREGSK